MRGLILGVVVVALALMAPLGPGRQASADALCAPYGSAWKRAKASGSLTAMDQVIAQIPASCSRELVNAQGERAEIVRKRAAAEQARQAQEAQARQEQARLRAVLEESARQTRLRAEREEADRLAAKKAQDEQARAEAAKPYSIKICNRSGEVVFMAIGHHPPSNTNIWKFIGWYKRENSECYTVSTDYNTLFYYAMNTSKKGFWGGGEVNYCANKEDTFEYTIDALVGRACTTKEPSIKYGKVVATSKDYTFNLDPATK